MYICDPFARNVGVLKSSAVGLENEGNEALRDDFKLNRINFNLIWR
jgi:hypothetical protein